MRVRIVGPAGDALAWLYAVEDLGEDWRCVLAGEELLLLLPGPESARALQELLERPPIAPPYVLGDGTPDGPLPPAERLPFLVVDWRQSGTLPALAMRHLSEAKTLAAGLLRTMEVPRRLRAWAFLPEMIALTVVHPPLLRDLKHGLYALVARRHGMSAAGVERSLRLCVESTWMHGSLGALERFFGSSVDPEKGKPTNREFLCRVQEQITLAMRRLM